MPVSLSAEKEVCMPIGLKLTSAAGWKARAVQMAKQALKLTPGPERAAAEKLAQQLDDASDLLGALSPDRRKPK
jgi:hypothetical protein